MVVSSQLRVLKTLQRYSRILEHALLLQMSKPILEMRVLTYTVYFQNSFLFQQPYGFMAYILLKQYRMFKLRQSAQHNFQNNSNEFNEFEPRLKSAKS